jgi:hypothetical protein
MNQKEITMRNKAISWIKVSKKDVKKDFQFFQDFYNFDIRNKDISLELADIQAFGVKITSKDTSVIKNTHFSQLNDEILFFSKSSNKDVKELIRHFKNMVSHPINIKKATINGKGYYRIFDCRFSPNRKESMKGVVSINNWRQLKKGLSKLINKSII